MLFMNYIKIIITTIYEPRRFQNETSADLRLELLDEQMPTVKYTNNTFSI